jgi:hypothetical protein
MFAGGHGSARHLTRGRRAFPIHPGLQPHTPQQAGLARLIYYIGGSGLRFGDGGFKLPSFGHDLSVSVIHPCDWMYDLSGAGGKDSFYLVPGRRRP